MKLGLFADGLVGYRVVDFIVQKHPNDLGFVCVIDMGSPIISLCKELKFDSDRVFDYNWLADNLLIERMNGEYDYFITAWWPRIMKKELFSIPRYGTLNLHPGLLPYNRGKHSSFWNLIEETPYGVTLHFVDAGIDTGDIVFQTEIKKDWTDTGKSLYDKAISEILNLFISNYENLLGGNFIRKKQIGKGTFHYSKDMQKMLEIELDRTYTARYLFNLLRAKDFPSSPQCYFYENGQKYEVNIAINRPKTIT